LTRFATRTVSLVARYLEANGLPTVIVGSALDIVEHCGVPRFLFTDFPRSAIPVDRRGGATCNARS